jgi:hypothetical protein
VILQNIAARCAMRIMESGLAAQVIAEIVKSTRKSPSVPAGTLDTMFRLEQFDVMFRLEHLALCSDRNTRHNVPIGTLTQLNVPTGTLSQIHKPERASECSDWNSGLVLHMKSTSVW